ncbi:protein of unknown function [Petrocella atlantisensis]|uniref:Uncharacterized protein n=1 Tax=Petrocella atlantisensis TaxID=2173034 RepID=A0A3P7RTQ2_9FIRM|nr:protein of unknown function [Petrocella atlantisensis]
MTKLLCAIILDYKQQTTKISSYLIKANPMKIGDAKPRALR